MSQVKTGDTVKVHYTGTLTSGQQFDSSLGKDPLEFKIGGGMVVPGFENAVLGMSVGEKKKVTIACQEAYGQRRQDLVFTVPRQQIPADIELAQGAMLQVNSSDGQAAVVTVADLNQETVTLDANHPLSGQDLVFDLELVTINGSKLII